MREAVVRHYGTQSYPGRADFGTRQFAEHVEDAIVGSEELLEKLNSAIFKFGWRYGITTDEARHLLLNTGVRL